MMEEFNKIYNFVNNHESKGILNFLYRYFFIILIIIMIMIYWLLVYTNIIANKLINQVLCAFFAMILLTINIILLTKKYKRQKSLVNYNYTKIILIIF